MTGPITLTVLDPEGSERSVAAGFCDVSTRTGGLHAPARASGMATPCWCGSLLPAPEGVSAADADVKVLVPPAMLVNAVSATVEGPGVLVFTALAVLDVDGDKLLDPARAEVLVGTGVDVAMNPVVLDDVDASTLVLTPLPMTTCSCSRLLMQMWRCLRLLQCLRMSHLPFGSKL